MQAHHASDRMLQNALNSGDPKHRRVRRHNPAFQNRLGQYPEVGHTCFCSAAASQSGVHMRRAIGAQILFADAMRMALMLVLPALALKRDDPGLIWLTLSAVKDSMVH
jgi:hypothetical protein